MDFYRETFTDAPAIISIPNELRRRKIEVIILPLDEKENGEEEVVERDKNGYPIGFFERTFGSLPDFPEREPQPEQSEREEF